ncbi:hypothetical protein BYT27DRAFT_7167117 [Phlegmacium glaucopus]|nr:hypothetical protein BYT27DRAFT_7167117 [Phlegmacium glaucopus]
MDLIFFPTLWLRNGEAATMQTRIAQVAVGWLVQVVYPLLTWAAKTSLALTIARLIPRYHPTHLASIIMAYLSILAGLGIVIQTCVYCTKVDQTWTHVSPFRCKVTPAAGIIRLGLEVIIDICLTLIPFIAFFWPVPTIITPPSGPNPPPNNPTTRIRLRLPPLTRRLIKVCFTASLLTAATAIIYMILLFKIQRSKSSEMRARTGYMAFVLSHLTGSVSLLACNMLIVITSLYRFLRTRLETPKIVEVGKSPVIPDLPSQVISESEHAISGTGERRRETTAGNTVENSSSLTSGGGHTSESSASYRVDFTELFESDFSSEPQRPTEHS